VVGTNGAIYDSNGAYGRRNVSAKRGNYFFSFSPVNSFFKEIWGQPVRGYSGNVLAEKSFL